MRLAVPPPDGNDLNPLLQDPGLAFHPPFLYLGYVGLSMAYSFAIAALIEGRVDAAWARWVRPWTLLAWVFLTVGIAMGSIWAYYELGWGGWWFWDPVENVSFMPWLISAALLHSAIVVEKRDTLKSWTILLAILAFSFSLVGAFIVRSGIITSVHAFADDPERGIYLLWILGAFIGGSLMLYAWRAPLLRSDAVFGVVSRESGLVVNNLLLVVATLVVFFGTMWPLLAEVLTGRKVSVGPPFFDLAFTPFMMALAVVLPPFAMLPWKRGSLAPRHGSRSAAPSPSPWRSRALVLTLQTGRSMLAPIGAALAAWLVLGALADLAGRVRLGQAGWREALRRSRNLPRADWGKALAHAGFGVTIWGIAAITAWAVEDIRAVKPGEAFPVAGYELRFDGEADARGPNYTTERATVTVFRGGREIGTLHPEKRLYDVQGMATTEAGIDRGLTPRPLRRARRPAGGRRLGAAHLRQALLQLDLARRLLMARGRRRQPDRPALPRRRPRPPRRPARGRSGGVRPGAPRAPRPCALPRAAGRPRGAARRDAPRPRPGGAGARDHPRAPLRRLPERVDRRVERRHRPRPAPPRARAHHRRRHATPRCRPSSSTATASSCSSARR